MVLREFGFVARMARLRKGEDETNAEFVVRKNAFVKKVLQRTTGQMSVMLLQRQWNYYGHIYRQQHNTLH
eukprot:1844005-Karenia_brevis.AAC.1